MAKGDTKLPPHDNDAEEAVVASILVDPDCVPLVRTQVRQGDFFREKNGWIYEAALKVYSRGEMPDQITVAHELAAMNRLEDVGGIAYLSRLVTDLPTAVGAEHYAAIVRRDSVYRQLISASGRIAQMAYEADGDLEGTLSQAQTVLGGVVEEGLGDKRGIHIRELMHGLADAPPIQEAGVLTGWPDLNMVVGSLRPGQVIVVAALTSRGKSAWLANLIHDVIIAGRSPLLFSLEMTREEFGYRLLSCNSGVPINRIEYRTLDDEEQGRVNESLGALGDTEAWLFDDVGDLSQIEAQAKARAVKGRVDLIAIDYLQLISGTRADTRTGEIGQITRRLKRLAKDLNVPVVAPAQLNRAAEMKADQRPTLANLRESGSIEQDADVVIFLHDTGARPTPGERSMEVIVAKQRQGPMRTMQMTFTPAVSRFRGRSFVS